VSKQETKSEARLHPHEAGDPVFSMLGVGKKLREVEPGDRFVDRLRAEDLPVPFRGRSGAPAEDAPESVWRRIKTHQGEGFWTARRLPFTYEVEGTGIWFFRDGRRINRKLSRTQVDLAIGRC